MLIAALTLIFATALFFFYLQSTCRGILLRECKWEDFRSVVSEHHLEFLSVYEISDADARAEYARLRTTLKRDFLVLSPLFANAVKVERHYSHEERLLVLSLRLLKVGFRLAWFALVTRHWLGLRERPAFLKLARILGGLALCVGLRERRRKEGKAGIVG